MLTEMELQGIGDDTVPTECPKTSGKRDKKSRGKRWKYDTPPPPPPSIPQPITSTFPLLIKKIAWISDMWHYLAMIMAIFSNNCQDNGCKHNPCLISLNRNCTQIRKTKDRDQTLFSFECGMDILEYTKFQANPATRSPQNTKTPKFHSFHSVKIAPN